MDVDLMKSVSPIICLAKITAHWPFGHKKLYTLYRWMVLLSMFVYNLEQTVYVILNITDFEGVASVICRLLSTIAVMIKGCIFDRNFTTVTNILDMLKSDEFQCNNEDQRATLANGVTVSNILFYFICVTTVITAIMCSITPMFGEERELPSIGWFPYDQLSDRYYAVTYMWQSIVLFYHGSINTVLDVFFATLMIQMGAQCDILGDKISNLSMSRSGNNRNIHDDLYKCIYHHKVILKCSQSIGTAFGNIVGVQCVTSVLVLCETLLMLSLTETSSATYFMLLTYQTALFIQIFLYCWFGNEVTVKSSRLSYATYDLKWYNFPQSFKRDLLFFMQKTQKPIVLFVGNIFPINVNTFTGILRSSWAYFMALRKIHGSV